MDTKFLRDAILKMSKNPISQNIIITIIEIIIVSLFVVYYKYIQKQEWFKEPTRIEIGPDKKKFKKIFEFFKQLFKLKWMHHTLLIMFIVALVINIMGLVDKTFVKIFLILMLILLYLEMIKNYSKRKLKETYQKFYNGNNDTMFDRISKTLKDVFKDGDRSDVYKIRDDGTQEIESIDNRIKNYVHEDSKALSSDEDTFKKLVDNVIKYKSTYLISTNSNNGGTFTPITVPIEENEKKIDLVKTIVCLCNKINNKDLFKNLYKNDSLFNIKELFAISKVDDSSLNNIDNLLKHSDKQHIICNVYNILKSDDTYSDLLKGFLEVKKKIDTYFVTDGDIATKLESLESIRNDIDSFKDTHQDILSRMTHLNPENKFIKILSKLDKVIGGTGMIDQKFLFLLIKIDKLKYLFDLEYREFYFLTVLLLLIAYLNINFMYLLEKQSSLFRTDPYIKLLISLIFITGLFVIIISLYNEKVYDSSEAKMKYFVSVYIGAIAVSYWLSSMFIFVQRQYFEVNKKDTILYKMSDMVVIGTLFPALLLIFLLQDPQEEPKVKTVKVYIGTIVTILFCIALDNPSVNNVYKTVTKSVRKAIERINIPLPSLPYYIIKILIIVIGVCFALLMPK